LKEWVAIKKIYVDYAATTPVDPRVVEAMKPYFTKFYGNASSLNSFGVEAKGALEKSRGTIAKLMKADADELIFTGSATEANNLVLKGYAFKEGKARCHIAVSTIDHDCILNSAVVHGNNEIGTIQSIREIARVCHEHDALFHTDAVQSFGKLPINVKEMNFDFMTINAHKLYGPKGVGALYINKDLKIEPLIHGGGHEFGLRSGTENIPGIVGFAKAVELRKEEMKPETERLTRLRDKLIKGVLEIKAAYLNGHPAKRLPNNTNFRFSFIEGEAVVLGLDTEGIAASSGSACSSTSGEPSHVLLAIGLKPEEARGSLRFSLGKYNTEEDIDYILQVLPKIVERLRAISPLKP